MASAGSPSVAPARQGGQIFRATTRVYSENIPIFAAAGAIFVPIYLMATGIQWVIFHLTSVAPLVALDGRHGAVTAFLAVLVGGVGGLFASVIATAVVAVILSELDAGRRILAGQAYRRVFRRWRSLGRGMATELGMALLLTITVVGIPFAIHRFIRWSLFAEACMLDDLPATESLRRSSELVKGRWWRTFGFTVPYADIQLTLYYFDLEARGTAESKPHTGLADRFARVPRALGPAE